MILQQPVLRADQMNKYIVQSVILFFFHYSHGASSAAMQRRISTLDSFCYPTPPASPSIKLLIVSHVHLSQPEISSEEQNLKVK